MGTLKIRGENDLLHISDEQARVIDTALDSDDRPETIKLNLTKGRKRRVEFDKIVGVDWIDKDSDGWDGRPSQDQLDAKKADELYEKKRKMAPKQKLDADMSRIKVLFKILDFDPKKDADKYKAFETLAIQYFEEWPNRTRVAATFWDIFGDSKGNEIRQNFTPCQKRVFQLLAVEVVQADIGMAYKYESVNKNPVTVSEVKEMF